MRSYIGAGGSQADASVTISGLQDGNAIGTAKGGTTADDGYSVQFVAHKSDNTWQVVYEGQQAPGSDIGTTYGLPSSWYTN